MIGGDRLREPALHPRVAEWDEFGGELIHSSTEPRAVRGRGGSRGRPGLLGLEIAFDLTEGSASKVWLSARTPPNVMLREGGPGIPGDMMAVALLRAPRG